MKKNALTLIVALSVIALLSSCSKSAEKAPEELIIGEWEGPDYKGETASFVFSEDRSAKILQGNLVLDGTSRGVKCRY